MSAIIILPEYAPPAPSGLLGVVYQDTFGGLSLAYIDTASTLWNGSAAAMWAPGATSPWSTVGINNTITGSFSGQGSDLTYCSATDELYWPGTAAATLERVARTSGASAGIITPPVSGNCQSIAYDAINDEFHISMWTPPGGAGGAISSFIPRANVDVGTWPTSGATVYFENFGGGMNGQEQWSVAWDDTGAGVLNGPHAGTLYALSGFFGLDYVTNWAADGSTVGTATGGGSPKSLVINNLSGGTVIYVSKGAGATVTIANWGVNTAPGVPLGGGGFLGGVATMTTTQLPNYDSSGFAWIFEYT